MSRTKKPTKHISKKALTQLVVQLFEHNEGRAFDLRTLFRELQLTTHGGKMLCMDVLEDLLLDDYITEKPKNTYTRIAVARQTLVGIFHRKANGKNTFAPDEGGEPILVAERNSLHAMDGDRVEATMMARRHGHVREAEVTKIVKRADKTFVGTLQVRRDIGFLLTEDRTLANDILIPRRSLKGGKTGDKAVVKIVEWPEKSKNPIGKVIDILGEAGTHTAEMHAILAEFGLPYVYPKQVEEAAERLPLDITPDDIAEREDMRSVMTFTIDPRDAKDYDDALSIRRLSRNLIEVGVHIADVSHYVKEGGIIDKEAQKRATSIYLVDRTIPMLPERLCNGVCSLRPGEDKLTYSVVFVMNEEAEVKDWHLAHTITRSDRRFIYEEVQQVLEAHGEASPEDLAQPGDHCEPEDPSYRPAEDFADDLIALNRLAKKLRARRFQDGAVNFDRTEVRFEIDAEGRPTSVYFKVAKDANKLVEEFMLLANRTVAESIGKKAKTTGRGAKKSKTDVPNTKAKTFVYRIHDMPDENKLLNLADFVKKFGHKMKATGAKEVVADSLNHLLADVKARPEQNLVETIALRAMMKARYSTLNIGHYGLAFDYYTHFTSPIRRYPDLMVHRLLTRYAAGGRSASKDKYEELCDHCSDMEELSQKAERASIKYKQVEYMQERLGEVFDGTISGVTEYGIYVEIDENKCEGMVPLRDLDDDYYDFDEKNYCLAGRRHHHRYSLGDKVKIKVARANLERKQLDFVLAKKTE